MYFNIKKPGIFLTRSFLFFILISFFTATGFAQVSVLKSDSSAKAATMVQTFYAINNEPVYWFSSRKDMKRAGEWLTRIGSSEDLGFVPDKLLIEQIRAVLLSNKNKINNALKEKTDKQITDLVLNFIKDLHEGVVRFEYDEVNVPRDSIYIYQLRNSRYKGAVSKVVSRFDCNDHDYLVLKKFLKDSIAEKNSLKYKTVVLAMNYRRYLTANHQPEYVLVNIPETEASYYRNDKLALKMKTVVGKKKNQTPTIASYITSIVTFPTWNVPFSIASKEILPKVQKDEKYLEQHNFDVVDAKGNVLEDSELNWKEYTEKNFPYFFRQSTGADNSLGVLKFDLKNPFSIFLHATSWQGAFAKDDRFLSHGCIRLEKPFELADALLRGKIDLQELKSGKKNTETDKISLPQEIPVYLIYVPVKVTGEKVSFLQDVYGLIK